MQRYYNKRFVRSSISGALPTLSLATARNGAIVLDYGRDIGFVHLVTRLVFGNVFNVLLEKDCVAYFRMLISDVPRLTGVKAPDR